MLKEILSVPMVVPSVVGCLVGLLHTFVLPIGNNPVVWLPEATPTIRAAMRSGPPMGLVVYIAATVPFLLQGRRLAGVRG